MSMTDFHTPVQIPREMFDRLIARVDQAVGAHAVALMLNEDFPFRALDPISPTAIDLSGVELDEDPLDIVNYLDQMLYFAFEGTPNEVIESWADERKADNLGAEAVKRVEHIRDNMPQLENLWRAKSDAIAPVLVGFEYDSATISGHSRANLYLSASRIASTGAPDKSDMLRLRVQLWPSDVRLLLRELEHLWSVHLGDSHDGREGVEDDASGDAQTP